MISIIIPCFNELATIETSLKLLKEATEQCSDDIETIVVDDGSTDGTDGLLYRLKHRVDQLILLKENIGKGAAVRIGLRYAKGQVVAVYDADLEYTAQDLLRVIAEVTSGRAVFSFGDRFSGSLLSALGRSHQLSIPKYSIFGNKLLSWLTSCALGRQVFDVETCLKAWRSDLIDERDLSERRFGFEIELVVKALRGRKVEIAHVPVSYRARSMAEGKKLRPLIDGLDALFCILRYGVI